MDGGQVPDPCFEHGCFGTQQVGDVSYPGFVAVSRDAKTLLRLGYGRLGHLDSLLGRAQMGVRTSYLQPNRGTRSVLLRSTALQRELALFDARLVAETVKQVPAQPNRHQPVGAPPRA